MKKILKKFVVKISLKLSLYKLKLRFFIHKLKGEKEGVSINIKNGSINYNKKLDSDKKNDIKEK